MIRVGNFTLMISFIFISRILDIISWCTLVHRISSYIHLSIEHLVRVCSFLLTLKSLCIKRWIRIGQDFMKSTNQWERQMCKGNYRVHSEYESTKSFETKRKKKKYFFPSVFLKWSSFFSAFLKAAISCCCYCYCYYQGTLVFLVNHLDAFDTFFTTLRCFKRHWPQARRGECTKSNLATFS